MPLELGADGQSHSLATYRGEKILGTHRTGGWVDPRAVLDWCKKKSCLHRVSNPVPSDP